MKREASIKAIEGGHEASNTSIFLRWPRRTFGGGCRTGNHLFLTLGRSHGAPNPPPGKTIQVMVEAGSTGPFMTWCR